MISIARVQTDDRNINQLQNNIIQGVSQLAQTVGNQVSAFTNLPGVSLTSGPTYSILPNPISLSTGLWRIDLNAGVQGGTGGGGTTLSFFAAAISKDSTLLGSSGIGVDIGTGEIRAQWAGTSFTLSNNVYTLSCSASVYLTSPSVFYLTVNTGFATSSLHAIGSLVATQLGS